MNELKSIIDIKGAPDFLTPPPPVPENEITETINAEVIVVGEGLAALCCALRAQQAGVKTVIVTASRKPVGRGGSVFAAYSKVMAERGMPRENHDKFLLQELASRTFQVDQRKFYRLENNSEEAINWLIDVVRAKGCDVVLEDANEDDHDSPTYQPPGTHAFVGKGVSRAGTGIMLALNAVEETFIEADGEVIRATVAKQLEKTDGRVTAVIAQKEDGSYLRACGKRGVVLATGDFSSNRKMMEFFCPQYADAFTAPGSDYDTGFSIGGLFKGDGHLMALWAGAAWQRTWPCAVVVQGSRTCSNLPYGSHRGLRLNANGERYCNEDMNGAYTAITTLREPGGKAYAIWGSNYAEDIRWRAHGGQRDGEDMTVEQVHALWERQMNQGKVFMADTLEEIIDILGLPREKAIAEIEHYNELCRNGKDTDFHKNAKYLQEIREAPFYGGIIGERLFFSVLGGPRTNWKMQICDGDDKPIPGLYCLGSMVGDLYSGCYNFRMAGENYGACMTFGYLTGKLFAENLD